MDSVCVLFKGFYLDLSRCRLLPGELDFSGVYRCDYLLYVLTGDTEFLEGEVPGENILALALLAGSLLGNPRWPCIDNNDIIQDKIFSDRPRP